MERLLELVEVRKELGIGRSTMDKLIKTGSMPYVQVGGVRKVERVALDAWIAAHRSVHTHDAVQEPPQGVSR
jgi:excisionase family DNA binding protein